ncbi:hypothetical protein Taro_007158 [Colocasia esculenta]|uniref:Uncharacterized protein n=1 Tax=Colocasia esculenta TaxID=4460 RepID=A0A843U316_COLES|nr:hypothetical protein [Colocasia esculenta]
MHMFSPPVEQDSGMVDIVLRRLFPSRGHSAQAEVLPENILICSQLCAYMYIFPQGNSAQAETLPEIRPYIHEYCVYMCIFLKGNSAQTEVLNPVENISICSRNYVHVDMSSKKKLCLSRGSAQRYIHMFIIYVFI